MKLSCSLGFRFLSNKDPLLGWPLYLPRGSILVCSSIHVIGVILREGAYVRVIGNLRSFKDAPNIVAFDIQVVEDFNQVTYHMLRAMYTHSLAVKKTQVCFMAAHASHALSNFFLPNQATACDCI